MSCRDTGSLWKELFLDPSETWNNRRIKTRLPLHFTTCRVKETGKDLCMTGSIVERDCVQEHYSLVDSIKACGKRRDLIRGNKIYSDVVQKDLISKDAYIGNALITMYARCGALVMAQRVFDEIPRPNIVSWNALITGYVQQGYTREALDCFSRMQYNGFIPDAITFACILKVCGIIGSLEKGEEIHAEIDKLGLLWKSVILCTALVDMYVKCGNPVKAKDVFYAIHERDSVLWTVLITGYVQNGLGNEALMCFEQMRDEGLLADAVTYASILKACSCVGSGRKGEEIHVQISNQGLLQNDTVLSGALVHMYVKCGMLERAEELFDELPMRSVATWNALMLGYIQRGYNNKALNCFNQMQDFRIPIDAITYASILKACGNMGLLDRGESIHREVTKHGILQNNVLLATALLDMYVKCGALAKAQNVFNEFPARDVILFNTLVGGYVLHGLNSEALNCFRQLQDQGLLPDSVTFTYALKACGNIGLIQDGERIHAEINTLDILNVHLVLATALLDMYAKCGALIKAQKVFDQIPTRDITSWTALIAGYSQHGEYEKALGYFQQIQDMGLSPDAVTFACVLKACASAGSVERARELHAELCRQQLLGNDIILGTALVDMYAKCGLVDIAQEVFDQLPSLDIISWNALVTGYAQIGHIEGAFYSYNRMLARNVSPDHVTYIVLLTMCSHAGLVEEAQMYFEAMNTVFYLTPTLEHYTCMVDLFSRAGNIEKAIIVIENSPTSDCSQLWLTLLSACLKWANLELGKWVFNHAIKLDQSCAAAYVCMSNMYATTDMQNDADDVEALKIKKGSMGIINIRLPSEYK